MIRAFLGVGAVIFLALLACLDFYSFCSWYSRSYQDVYRVSVQQERFREVTSALPQGSVLGYLSDVPFEQVRGSAAFFGAQYALAPHLLVDYQKHRDVRWVVGDFSGKADLGQIQAQNRLRLVRDFGNGVALFAVEAR